MKFMTALPLTHATGAVLISLKTFKKLPENLGDLLITTFEKEMRSLTLTLRNQNIEAVKLIQDSGLTIVPVPLGQDLDEFYSIHDKVAKNLTGAIYPKKVLKQVYDILKR
jgi:TRAP-type C4-dicarboxylate transport system substrate-binding protein